MILYKHDSELIETIQVDMCGAVVALLGILSWNVRKWNMKLGKGSVTRPDMFTSGCIWCGFSGPVDVFSAWGKLVYEVGKCVQLSPTCIYDGDTMY